MNNFRMETGTQLPTEQSDTLLKEMDARWQAGEPLASRAVRELEELARAAADRAAGAGRAELEKMTAAWRAQFFAGYRLAQQTGLAAARLLTDAPEGAAWRQETLRLTRLGEQCPEYTALADRWDDLLALALVLGERRG